MISHHGFARMGYLALGCKCLLTLDGSGTREIFGSHGIESHAGSGGAQGPVEVGGAETLVDTGRLCGTNIEASRVFSARQLPKRAEQRGLS